MKVLHVDSSFGEAGQSVSRLLSQEIIGALKKRGATEIIYRDLAKHPFLHLAPEHMVPAGAEKGPLSPALAADKAESAKALQEFLDADVVVIGSPLYNLNVPTTLKGWIDRLCVVGKTFKYTEKGPVGLTSGKVVLAALAYGGVYAPGTPAAAYDFINPYLKAIFGLTGVRNYHSVRAEGLNISPEVRAKAIEAAKASIPALMDKLPA